MLKLLTDLKRFKQTGRGMFSEQLTREAVVRERDELIRALEAVQAAGRCRFRG